MTCWKRILQRLFGSPALVRKSSDTALFGIRRERPKARRPKAKVTPRLEGLEERTIPSASTMPQPQMTDMTAQMVSTLEQRTQLIATVEEDLISVWDTLVRSIAQEMASVEQQWGHLVGITPPQAASGSGSGSGAMTTTLNATNQAPKPVTPQSGSGSGRGAAATALETATTQRAKPLVESGSGSGSSGGGSGSGSLQFGSLDTLEWAPADPGVIPWIDLSKENKRLGYPSWTNPIVFDGSHDDAIEGAGVFASLTVRNGYDAQIVIPAQGNLEVLDTLVVDNKSTFHVTFGADSIFDVDNGGTITNMILAGDPTGTLYLNGGTMSIDPNPGGYTEKLGANLSVTCNATLNYGSYDTLQFTNDKVKIDVGGTMNTYFGPGTGITLISSNGYKSDYIYVEDGGQLNYYGSGGVTDTFTAPIYLNDGFLNVSVGSVDGVSQPNGGSLIVQDGSGYIFPNGSKESVYLAGAISTVMLSNGAVLECENGYYQSDGTLETMDSTTCTLIDDTGTTIIAGGNVKITASGGVGTLKVVTSELNFGADLSVTIVGNTGSPGQSSKFNLGKGLLSLDYGDSSLTVNVNGQPGNGNAWIVINSGQIIGDFSGLTSTPQTNLNYSPDPQSPPWEEGEYVISF